jgi:hypothetical protein
VRPPELDRSTSLRNRVRRLLLGPRFGRFTDEEWERWADSLAEIVISLAQQTPGTPVTGPIRAHRVTVPLADIVSGVTDGAPVTFHAVSLGEPLAIVGVSAEVVTEYGSVVRRYFADRLVIPVGYIDEVYGYLPTARMLEEGGYEVEWFLEAFGLDGHLQPDLEVQFHGALKELAAGVTASLPSPRV